MPLKNAGLLQAHFRNRTHVDLHPYHFYIFSKSNIVGKNIISPAYSIHRHHSTNSTFQSKAKYRDGFQEEEEEEEIDMACLQTPPSQNESTAKNN